MNRILVNETVTHPLGNSLLVMPRRNVLFCSCFVRAREIWPAISLFKSQRRNSFLQLVSEPNSLTSEVLPWYDLISNTPYSNSRYWNGTSSQLRLKRGIFPNETNLFAPHEPPLRASSSPILRLRIWPIGLYSLVALRMLSCIHLWHH